MDIIDRITCNNIVRAKRVLRKYGVAIYQDYFNEDYVDTLFQETRKWLIDLNIGMTDNPETWTFRNTPLGGKYGTYQSTISNCPNLFQLREDMYPLFRDILEENELLTTLDGASIYPVKNAPKNKKDWAHIDQTENSDLMCYQSQIVTTNTTASFVCTPFSHHYHAQLMRKFKIPEKGNFYIFNDKQVAQMDIHFEYYQIPIIAPKGSIIIWDSRTIHSARGPTLRDDSWRGVFYVSMRPKINFSTDNINTIQTALRQGKSTNHWGKSIFYPNGPIDRFNQRSQAIIEITANSERLSNINNLTEMQKKMYGLIDY